MKGNESPDLPGKALDSNKIILFLKIILGFGQKTILGGQFFSRVPSGGGPVEKLNRMKRLKS